VIPNITRGGSVAGIVEYLAGPGDENEHEHPELLAASPAIVAESSFRTVPIGGKRNQKWLTNAIDAPRIAWGREVRQRDRTTGKMEHAHVWHCSLTLAPGEQLTPVQWQRAGRQFVKAMNFDGCEWALVRHGKTGRDQLEHVHLVVNLVQTETGKPASVHNDYSRAQAACAKLSRDLGLTELQGQQRHLPERERRPVAPRRLRQGVRHEIVERFARAEQLAAGREMTRDDLATVGVVQRVTERGAAFALIERRDVMIPLSDINGRIDEDNAATEIEQQQTRDQELVETAPEKVARDTEQKVARQPLEDVAPATREPTDLERYEAMFAAMPELREQYPDAWEELQTLRALEAVQDLAKQAAPSSIEDASAAAESLSPAEARPANLDAGNDADRDLGR
jgi:hypothetical protein